MVFDQIREAEQDSLTLGRQKISPDSFIERMLRCRNRPIDRAGVSIYDTCDLLTGCRVENRELSC
jgi:hypothetical protein